MKDAVRTILAEHRSISAVLSGLKSLARMMRDTGVRPDFKVLHAMVYYIDTFPERMHHPKENDHLFARLRERDPGARDLVESLQAEHASGSLLVRELERSLNELELTWPIGTEAFAATVDAYADFHWNHMRREEHEAIPRAQKVFTAQDWAEMDKAFSENYEPLSDLDHTDFNALFQRILTLAPDPVGLGERWKEARPTS